MRPFWIIVCIASLSVGMFALNHKGGSPSSHPRTLSEAVEKVSASIVRVDEVFSYQIQGDSSTYQWISSGTGFIVDSQGDVATAYHVIDAAHAQRDLESTLTNTQKAVVPGSFRVQRLIASALIPNTESDAHGNELYNIGRTSEAGLSKQDQRFDIAILSCKENLLEGHSGMIINGQELGRPSALPEFQTVAPRPGDPIAVTGFPGYRDNLTRSNVQIPGLTTNTGTVANATFEAGNHLFVYLADMRVNQGDSGGPVYNSTDGRIIGFVDAYLNATDGGNSGLAVIVPIRHVLDLVQH